VVYGIFLGGEDILGAQRKRAKTPQKIEKEQNLNLGNNINQEILQISACQFHRLQRAFATQS
jgi:hypothetical protein